MADLHTPEPVNAELLAALRALTDWGREHTSPRDANSPHDLLIRAVAAIDKADADRGYARPSSHEVCKANALLIAAAPELLEACRAAEQILCRVANISTNDNGNFRNVSTISALAEVRAAIAKAFTLPKIAEETDV
jgi:hypothetical protein